MLLLFNIKMKKSKYCHGLFCQKQRRFKIYVYFLHPKREKKNLTDFMVE